MPRSGPKLTDGEVALLERWIDDGAQLARRRHPKATAARDEETWWSLRPLKRPAVPAVKDAAWARTPIDAFVLAALEASGLRPSPEADRRTLHPPADVRPDRPAADARGGRGLRRRPSPRRLRAARRPPAGLAAYGERWGRHWLDVAHYGDTHGYDKDKRRDHAWPYRDWVIRAFNADMPYPRLRPRAARRRRAAARRPRRRRSPPASSSPGRGTSSATSSCARARWTRRRPALLDRDDMVTNAIGTFLSLTVHCARCHDHKFDPIPQSDYYRLQAVFAGVERGDRRLDDAARRRRRRARAQTRRLQAERRRRAKKIDAVTSPELEQLDAELTKLRKRAGRAAAAGRRSPARRNGYHSGIVRDGRTHVKWVQVDLGASLPHRRGAPVPGPADRLPRHAGLRLPGALQGRGRRRRRRSRKPIVARRPHDGATSPTPATTRIASALEGAEGPLRPRDGDEAVEAARTTTSSPWPSCRSIPAARTSPRGKAGDRRSTRSRRAAGAGATSSMASTAASACPT